MVFRPSIIILNLNRKNPSAKIETTELVAERLRNLDIA